MNKKPTWSAIFLTAVVLAPLAQAAELSARNSVGISRYTSSVSYNGLRSATLDLNGFALFATRALDHHLALRGGWFQQHHTSDMSADGIDIQLLAGNNFDRKGLKLFGGVGYLRERWGLSEGDVTLESPQVTMGVGYNWDDVSVEWWGAVRAANEYDKLAPVTASAAATAGSLLLSYRF